MLTGSTALIAERDALASQVQELTARLTRYEQLEGLVREYFKVVDILPHRVSGLFKSKKTAARFEVAEQSIRDFLAQEPAK